MRRVICKKVFRDLCLSCFSRESLKNVGFFQQPLLNIRMSRSAGNPHLNEFYYSQSKGTEDVKGGRIVIFISLRRSIANGIC